MDFLKMALSVDFLLFVLGIFWLDIAEYIQKWISNANPKLFGFIMAAVIYMFLKRYVS